ncbi:MAG: S1/P1 nuclease, partial [Lysobacterales bacterium]
MTCFSLAGYSGNASSWGQEGHTAIGIMAVAQLQPESLHALESIVNPLTKEAMAAACNWPDVYRKTGEGEWSEPLHYINIPRDEVTYSETRDCPEDPEKTLLAGHPPRQCATEAIKYFAAGLADTQASAEQRRQSFAWLCHLVGDLHQPLHAGFGDDRGGNDVTVVFNDEEMNLHHFWDSALILEKAGSWQY